MLYRLSIIILIFLFKKIYYLLSAVSYYCFLTVCTDFLNYFQPISKCYTFQDSFKVENVVLASFNLFSKFVKEIVVRLQQFKDELLASCLQVLLVLPTEIVLKEIHILISALEVLFILTISYCHYFFSTFSYQFEWKFNAFKIIIITFNSLCQFLNSDLDCS